MQWPWIMVTTIAAAALHRRVWLILGLPANGIAWNVLFMLAFLAGGGILWMIQSALVR